MWYQTLENRFLDGKPDDVSIAVDGHPDYSGKWRRYRDGTNLPKKYGNSNPIPDAERVWPGSSEIWVSPTWQVLKGERINAQTAIDGIYKLGGTMRTTILAGGFKNWPISGDSDNGVEELFELLAKFPTFELLQALILMLPWADDIRNPKLWDRICDFYRFIIPDLLDRAKIPCHEDYLTAVDKIACVREFTSANEYRDIPKSWKEELPRFEQMKAAREAELQEYWRDTPKLYAGSDYRPSENRYFANSTRSIASFRRHIAEWRQRPLRLSDPA
jgi:hypothetical protein